MPSKRVYFTSQHRAQHAYFGDIMPSNIVVPRRILPVQAAAKIYARYEVSKDSASLFIYSFLPFR